MGAIIAWNTIMMSPRSVHRARPADRVPLQRRSKPMKKAVCDNFFYIQKCQEPGAAEAEFDKEPREFLSRIYPRSLTRRAQLASDLGWEGTCESDGRRFARVPRGGRKWRHLLWSISNPPELLASQAKG